MSASPTHWIQEPARATPVRAEFDVLVVGGGPAGLMAGRAAAAEGMRVGLVESRSFVGGNLTLGLPVLGFLSQKGQPIIRGLPEQFIERLRARGAASEHQPCPLHVSITFLEPEAVPSVALDLLRERGVEVMLYTQVVGVIRDGQRVRGVLTESKAGREALEGRVVVDCTGDADVAFRAGVPCAQGDAQGGLQPPTLMFCVAGVDTEKLRFSLARDPARYRADFIPPEYFEQHQRFIVVGLRECIQAARAAGLSLPTDRTILITGLRPGEVWVNMTRVKGTDGTDPRSLTAGEIEARRQLEDILRYLTRFVPGFEQAYLAKCAPFLGIRETRRIIGQYVLSREDLLGCRRFADAIAVASYPIDLHRPNDNDCTLEWCGDCYDLPYRALVPQHVENLLVAGRCISTTHEAMAAVRVMSTCMALGEAAGCAARLSVRDGVPPSALPATRLREELVHQGVYLR